MSVAQLLSECDARGIRLSRDGGGGLTIDAPRDALTADLLERLKANKQKLLEAQPAQANASNFDSSDVSSVWQAALDLVEGDPLFPNDVMEALRTADVEIKQSPDTEDLVEIGGHWITKEDYAFLTRPKPGPCFFCGGRTVHSKSCLEQKRSWIIMPHGQYKGRAVTDVPIDYLRWFLREVKKIDPEVRAEIKRVCDDTV